MFTYFNICNLWLFLPGRGYYKFDRRIGRVPVGYPAFIRSDWPGLPGDIDAALQWINGWTYFFKDEQFYRWDFVKNKVARMYPRSTDSVWLGCTPLDERNECWVPQCMWSYKTSVDCVHLYITCQWANQYVADEWNRAERANHAPHW